MQNHQQATSHVWDVDGLEYHGKIWGPADGIPMLALHGWMDHCESFDVLAPLLTGCRIVAIDLSGQGLSSHRAPHASYNIWDDLPQIAAIMDQLGWSDCVLLGHSRGAIMATMFAAALPERVRAVVALDALLPEPTEFTTPDTLRAFIEQTARQKQKPPRVFDTIEAYVARRVAQGNDVAVSKMLAPRALHHADDGYVLRGDARMFASSAVKLKPSDINDFLRAVRCPYLNIWAKDGIKVTREKLHDMERRAIDLMDLYQTVEIEGDHHFHMNATVAPVIADRIFAFLDL